MKKILAVSIASLAFVIGCGPGEAPKDAPPTPPELPKQEAPAAQAAPESAKHIVDNYAGGLVKSIDKAKTTQSNEAMASLQTAVNSFQAENGKYPDSLAVVKDAVLPPVDVSPYNYDPATGKVSLK